MAVKSPRISSSSALNPDAPHFVPSFFDAVDDFSVEWWSLVKSTPAFRDYWIREKWENVTSALEDYLDRDPEPPSPFDDLELEDVALNEADTLKEQDLNLCAAARPLNLTDLLSCSPPPASTKNFYPRQPREKIVKVPAKLAAAQMRKGSLSSRIQQPR